MPHMLFRTQDDRSMCVCGLDLRYHILQHPGMSLHVRMTSSSCLRAATASVAYILVEGFAHTIPFSISPFYVAWQLAVDT